MFIFQKASTLEVPAASGYMTREQLEFILATDGLEPEMADAFLRANQELVDKVTLRKLKDAIGDLDAFSAIASIPFEVFDRAFGIYDLAVIDKAVRTGGAQAVEEMLARDMKAYYDPLDDVAVTWTRLHGAELVKDVSEGTQEGIRESVQRAIEQGGNPATAATQIKGMIGLDPRLEKAVDNYRRSLIEQKMPAAEMKAALDAYRDKLLTYRANRIARTEIAKAMNAGRQFAWEQGIEQGTIDPAIWMKEWETANDEHVCKVCGPLHMKQVEITKNFQTKVGLIMTPPAHPMCRCRAKLMKRRVIQ